MPLNEITLTSNFLGTTEHLLIYTPERYSPLYSYPVLYVQDGEDYLSLGRLATLLEQLHREKEIPDLIAVFLPVDKSRRYARYHPDGDEHLAYRRFLAVEAVGYVDRHYSTHPLGQARTLLGESLGGVVSLFTALAYPHTFGQVACQSAAMDEALNRRVAEAELPASLHVYLEVGTEKRRWKRRAGRSTCSRPTNDCVTSCKQKGSPWLMRPLRVTTRGDIGRPTCRACCARCLGKLTVAVLFACRLPFLARRAPLRIPLCG